MRRRSAAVAALLILLATGGCGGDSGTPPVAAIAAAADRPEAPDLTGELLDGTAFDPATLDGMVVVVNFWASWCAPCRAEIGELNATFEATRDLDVRFVGVNVRDSRDPAKAFVEGRETYPSLFDPPSRIAMGFRDVSPSTIPATVIIDRSGRVATVLRKAVTREELEPLIRTVAAEDD